MNKVLVGGELVWDLIGELKLPLSSKPDQVLEDTLHRISDLREEVSYLEDVVFDKDGEIADLELRIEELEQALGEVHDEG